jgi:hypothetical protein
MCTSHNKVLWKIKRIKDLNQRTGSKEKPVSGIEKKKNMNKKKIDKYINNSLSHTHTKKRANKR